jgi:dienelactone hydrolase
VETDLRELRENTEELEIALKRTGRQVIFYVYEDTGHWFFEPDHEDVCNEATFQLGLKRTLESLKSVDENQCAK